MNKSRCLTTPLLRSALPGPDNILRRTLPNGITVLARENWSAPSVVVEGYLQAGSLDEPSVSTAAFGQSSPLPGTFRSSAQGDSSEHGLVGLASYTASMLSRGTRRRTFAEINETIESVGAAIGFSADRHTTSFSAKSLAEDLDLVLDVLVDELRQPVFPADHVEKVRGLRMTTIAERENDTRQMASLAFRELLYGDHPLGRDLLGSRESNAAMTRDDLVAFYETCYRPHGMVAVVVGALPAEEAVAKVATAFGDWSGQRPARPALPPVPHPLAILERRVPMPDKSQSDIILGWQAMRRLDPDFEAARLANTVLGVFGMMGRLGTSVRERGGMAYYAYSRLNADKLPGPWVLIAGVNPVNVERAIQTMLDEVRRMCDEKVPVDELEDSKHFLTGSLPLRLETNDGVASVLVDLEWYELGMDYLLRYTDTINAITPEDVQAAAQKYFNPQAYALAIAGP